MRGRYEPWRAGRRDSSVLAAAGSGLDLGEEGDGLLVLSERGARQGCAAEVHDDLVDSPISRVAASSEPSVSAISVACPRSVRIWACRLRTVMRLRVPTRLELAASSSARASACPCSPVSMRASIELS